MKSYEENIQDIRDLKEKLKDNFTELDMKIGEINNQIDSLEDDYLEASTILDTNKPYIYDYLNNSMTNQTKFFSIAYVLFGFFIPLILLQDVHLTIFMSFMFLSAIIYYVVRILFFKIRKRFKLKHPDIVLPSVIGSIFLVAFSLMFVQYLRYDNYLYIEFLYMYASFCFAVFYLLLISTFAKAKQRLYQDEINQKSELNNLQAKYVGILNIPQHIKTETDKKREELHAVEVRFREIVYSDPTFTQLKAEYCSSKVCDLLEYYINTDQANDIESCISVFSKESVDIKMQYSTNI